MDLKTFVKTFKSYKDADKIEIKCDHPDCTDPFRIIGKQPARRNIMKNGGEKFICRDCMMKYNNPMTHVGESRQSDEIISVKCPTCKSARDMKKSCYFGDMNEPFQQICKSCAFSGREVSEETKQAISAKLSGVPKSQEFKDNLSEYMKTNPEGIERGKANLVPGIGGGWNEGMATPPEVKAKQSAAMMGIEKTEEHKANISIGRKKMLAEQGGHLPATKEKISKAIIEQYRLGFNPTSHHRKGYHTSKKNGAVFCYRSSYELLAFTKMDDDETIESYIYEHVHVSYVKKSNNYESCFLIDFYVLYKNGTKAIIEVKPECMLKDEIVLSKLLAAKIHADNCGYKLEIWTEKELGMTAKDITVWADEYASNIENYTKKLTDRELANLRQKKHYREKIATDTVEVYCDYCKETHNPLRKTYDKNVERNGTYICEKHGGHIAGKKPKKKKVNSHAAEGKKQCLGACGEVLDLNLFGLDKSKQDGHSSRCMKCRAAAATKRYQEKLK